MRHLAPLFIAIAAWLLLTGADTAPLDVRADRMELRQKGGTIEFEGHVVANQGELKLRCSRLTARYAKDGSLVSLEATGDITVEGEGISASAQSARYDRKTDTLVLTGTPTLKRRKDRITGERITLWPESGRVVVEQARGRIQAPKLRRFAPK